MSIQQGSNYNPKYSEVLADLLQERYHPANRFQTSRAGISQVVNWVDG